MKIARICYLGPNGTILAAPIGVLTPCRKSLHGVLGLAVKWIQEPLQPNGHYHIAVYDEHSEAFLFGKPEGHYEIVKDNEIWGYVP